MLEYTNDIYGITFNRRSVVVFDLFTFSHHSNRWYSWNELSLIFSSAYSINDIILNQTKSYVDIFAEYKKWKLQQ